MEYTIKINGRQLPARFTLRVAILAAERRGGNIVKLLANENQAEQIADLPWLAVEMVKAGAALRERETGIVTTNIPTVDELLDTVDYDDLLDLQAQIMAVIKKDQPTVQAEPSEEKLKNAEATPAT